MAYIGRGTDKLSNIEKLDVITFDGSSSYTLQKNSVNFTPSSANNLQVSIDGVVQAGNFTVSGSTIDFGVAIPATSTNDFIFHYGTGLITTPADGTVGLAQLSATGTKDATTFLRGDNTFAEAGGGKVLQVVSFATTSGTNTTSTSFVDTALTASITPSSTSNKVFIIVSQNAEMGAGSSGYITLDRNGTNLSNSTGFAVVQLASYSMPCGISYLDSPSSTSALTYKVQIRSGDGTSFNHNSQNPKASITLMEISA